MNLLGQQSCFSGLHYCTGRYLALLSVGAFLACPLPGHAKTIEIPPGSPLSVELLQHSPMKAGEPLEGRLVYPVFIENRIAIPAGSILQGRVIRLDPDRSRRIHSGLHADFTPFRTPVVQFDHVVIERGARRQFSATAPKMACWSCACLPRPRDRKARSSAANCVRQSGRSKRRLPYSPRRAEATD